MPVGGLSVRGSMMIAVRTGVGKIVSRRPASELTMGVAGEDGCCNGGGGMVGGMDVCMCTDMDMCTGDVWCCWLIWWGLGLGWGCSCHGESTMISISSSYSGLSTIRSRFWRGLVVLGVCSRQHLPFLWRARFQNM